MFNKIARPFVTFVEKYYPDPLIFAILLTFIGFILAFIFTDASFIGAVSEWGGGFKLLMAFTAQMAFTLVSSIALAHTKPVIKLLQKIADLPKTSKGCYALAAFVAGVASLFTWALGLVVGAIISRHVQFRAQQKGIKLHFPLLVAAAYSGFVIWHMGYSGSAQLFVATAGHIFEGQIGIIPVTETLLASYNILGAIICLIAVPAIVAFMEPKSTENLQQFDEATLEEVGKEINPPKEAPAQTWGEKIERMRWISFLFALGLIIYLVWHFATKGMDLNLNIVCASFLALGLLLADHPKHYVYLVTDAGKTVGQIILQYPIYACLIGLMSGTGLAKVIAGWFASFSTELTLPFFGFLSAGLLNIFIPSGGGQWSVQGAVLIEAAQELGTNIPLIVNAVAYGDQWTNMIQPFWTIPILAIAGCKMRDMMGYTFVTLLVTFVIFTCMLFLGGAMT
ncbi:MAG: TIGR00366 family protein [Desulfobacteraceae bacterium]|nr:TIGR00366 family protein [Desulfobacteraceae bacterium]